MLLFLTDYEFMDTPLKMDARGGRFHDVRFDSDPNRYPGSVFLKDIVDGPTIKRSVVVLGEDKVLVSGVVTQECRKLDVQRAACVGENLRVVGDKFDLTMIEDLVTDCVYKGLTAARQTIEMETPELDLHLAQDRFGIYVKGGIRFDINYGTDPKLPEDGWCGIIARSVAHKYVTTHTTTEIRFPGLASFRDIFTGHRGEHFRCLLQQNLRSN